MDGNRIVAAFAAMRQMQPDQEACMYIITKPEGVIRYSCTFSKPNSYGASWAYGTGANPDEAVTALQQDVARKGSERQSRIEQLRSELAQLEAKLS